MEDNGHMSEKLLLSEMNNERLKIQLQELSSQTEQAVDSLNTSSEMTLHQKDLLSKTKARLMEALYIPFPISKPIH